MTCTDDTHGGFIRKPTLPERSKRDRINRLRSRLRVDENLRDIVKGVLDLLEDEL